MGWLDSWRRARAEQGLRAMPERLGRELQALQDSLTLLENDIRLVGTADGDRVFLLQLEQFILASRNIDEHIRLIAHWSKQHPEITIPDDFENTLRNARQLSLQAIEQKKASKESGQAIIDLGRKIIRDAEPLLQKKPDQETGIEILEKYQEISKYPPEVIQFATEHPYDIKLFEKNADRQVRYLFEDCLPTLARVGLLTRENWALVIESGKNAGPNADYLFNYGLPALARNGLLTRENALMLAELGKNAGDYGGDAIAHLSRLEWNGLLTQENWPLIVELVEKAGKNAVFLFAFGLTMLDRNHLLNRKNLWWMVALCNNAGKDQETFFLYIAKYGWKTTDELKRFGKNGASIARYTQGTAGNTCEALGGLRSSRFYFGDAFSDFELAIAKSQRVASYLIFERVKELFDLHCLKTTEDLNVIIKVCNQYKPPALTIMKEVLVAGKKQGIIRGTLSEESDVLNAFLKETPAYLLSLYIPFKKLWQGNLPDRDRQVTMLFKDGRELLQDIKDGVLRREYPQELLFGVLYSIFACNDMTVPKENYIHAFNERNDRQNDIPKAFWKPYKVNLSKGGYILKDENTPIQQEAWNTLVNVAGKIREKKDVDITQLGFSMLALLGTDGWKSQRAHFLEQVYQVFVNSGQSLPEFRLDHSILMSYKEFVGDRLPNDILPKIFQECLAQDSARFINLQEKFTGRKAPDTSQLASFINNKVLKTGMPEDKKKEVIMKVFSQNKIPPEEQTIQQILKAAQTTEVKQILDALSGSIIDKALITKTHLALYGAEYEGMRREMGKYDFHDTEGEGKYTFLISKRKMHSCAMFNMGVCVAPDDTMWNSPDMWQLIIFDENGYAHGGTIMRTIMHNGSAYLVLSIQPAGSLLTQASPEAIFDKTIQYARIITKKLGYRGILIPTNTAISSNRGSIQDIITKRYGQTTPLTTESYQFSNNPSYPYSSFYQIT
jgi:hypothetical protein